MDGAHKTTPNTFGPNHHCPIASGPDFLWHCWRPGIRHLREREVWAKGMFHFCWYCILGLASKFGCTERFTPLGGVLHGHWVDT